MIRALAASIAATLAYVACLRPWFMRWGATAHEVATALPGDDLIANPPYRPTRAITIKATPTVVWPWLVQMGQGRGGFYTYAALERRIGAAIENADRIIPELQHLAVGDTIRLSKVGGPAVVGIDPSRSIVLHDILDVRSGRSVPAGPPAAGTVEWTWAFVLRPVAGDSTRLTVRTRARFTPAVLAPFFYLLLEPMHFVMERGMLRGIRQRAEDHVNDHPSARPSSHFAASADPLSSATFA